MEQLGSHWMDFREIWYLRIFCKCRKSASFIKNLTRITGTLHEHLRTFMIISLWIRLRLRNVSVRSCRENQNTYFMFNKFYFFFRKLCRLRDNVENYGRATQATRDNIIRLMRFACWITKATDTRSAYVTFIALPQQWLRERASLVHCTYIACLVIPQQCGCCKLTNWNNFFCL